METIRDMTVLFLSLFRFVRLLLGGHQAIVIENAALRMQLAAFQRKRKRPLLTTLDRVFWITLRSLWSDWRHPLIYVQADTVVRWHRERFRRFWARRSQIAAPASRTPEHRPRTSPINRTNGRGQSVVARTQDSWRTQNARHRDLGAYRIAPPAQAPPPA